MRQSVEKHFGCNKEAIPLVSMGPDPFNCLLVVVPTLNLTRGTGIRSLRQWFTLAYSCHVFGAVRNTNNFNMLLNDVSYT